MKIEDICAELEKNKNVVHTVYFAVMAFMQYEIVNSSKCHQFK